MKWRIHVCVCVCPCVCISQVQTLEEATQWQTDYLTRGAAATKASETAATAQKRPRWSRADPWHPAPIGALPSHCHPSGFVPPLTLPPPPQITQVAQQPQPTCTNAAHTTDHAIHTEDTTGQGIGTTGLKAGVVTHEATNGLHMDVSGASDGWDDAHHVHGGHANGGQQQEGMVVEGVNMHGDMTGMDRDIHGDVAGVRLCRVGRGWVAREGLASVGARVKLLV